MFDPKKLLDKNGNPSSRKISPYKEEIFAATAWMLPTASIGERFWNILHGRTSYIEGCTICGNPVHWRGQDGYYQLYCSVQCSGKARTARTPVKQVIKLSKEEIDQKKIQSNQLKYGVDWAHLRPEAKANRAYTVKLKTVDKWFCQLKNRKLTPLFTKEEYISSDDASREKLEVKCECGTQFHIQRYKEDSIPGLCPTCYTPNASRWQHEVNDFIRSLGVETRLNDRKVYSNKLELDIFIPSKNLVIECDGAWWHSEGGRHNIKQVMINKHKVITSSGYKLISIFDFEWEEKKDLIKSRIISALGLSKKLHARQTAFKEVDTKEAIDFFESTHLAGSGKGKVFGLYHNNELVSAMQFSKPRWAKEDVEIIRFSSKLNYTISGAASKLLKNSINKLEVSSVVSYADLRFGEGKVYEKLGFKRLENTGPSYFYVNSNNQRRSRHQHQVKKLDALFGPDTGTEVERCAKNGWYRVWTPGNAKYSISF